MSYSIVLRPKAEKAIDGAAGWYEARNPRASRAFLDAVDAALARILENPHQFPVLKHKLRRVIVTGFPYSVLFRDVGTTLIVTNCVHFRRHPRHWRTG